MMHENVRGCVDVGVYGCVWMCNDVDVGVAVFVCVDVDMCV